MTPITAATASAVQWARVTGTGTAFILGQALQAATTLGDELLVLIGSGH